MFGMGFFELLVVLVVAIIFLGPEKFPKALVDIVKFFRAVKKTLNDAKETLDKEIHIEELRQQSLEYKKYFEEGAQNVQNSLKRELDEVKQIKELQEFKEITQSIAKDNPLDSLSEEVQADEKPKVSLEKKPPDAPR
ncbi:Sec-independent protein translocase protein TatB [Helicobacter bizzozeronii]|uniref:Sec-independent protein translocase protein TatB n=1 Tax=Helicobacter bizzozeronii TaxID=56877 RepID=UPI000CF0F569|nr:Sec-independent protein translocase protein TatB [Helicobacter bizzozeronii]